ncbi:uncharacterized protein LOC101857722 [Aplysia californica]|uniref:Uncharacterized protein LOC101857722 n=1 Tax=Aplysia californica TaxID=6500 RepID=A0ABM0JR20_APLCA|nr:uncharacterized protein LOC101857722 [Aplysia californica]XP_005099521.1 uncharacterized protein LOC101857722 [Aplysia californica]
MTSTADPQYIRSVSVSYPRCGSGVSLRSTLSGTNYVIQRSRPRTAEDITHSARDQADRILERERTGMLDELMFLYGRNVSNSFDFSPTDAPKPPQKNYSTPVLSSPWHMNNSAFLQMYRASGRCPRKRQFPQFIPRPLTRETNS